MTDPHAGDRGFALLIVLWAVVLLALLGTGLAATGRTEVQIAASLRAAAAAEAAADGAVYEAAFHLLDPDQPWAADGRERVVLIADASVTVRIDNQAGKVSPNLAEPDLLRVLLRRLGTDTQTASRLSDAIADWRFPGSQPRPNGAKSPQYLAAGLDYGPPGTPFTDLDELGSGPWHDTRPIGEDAAVPFGPGRHAAGSGRSGGTSSPGAAGPRRSAAKG